MWRTTQGEEDPEQAGAAQGGGQGTQEAAALSHRLLSHLITFLGVPSTWQILKIVSISLAPGKSGRSVYTSAMMQPTAQMSMGEL